MRTCRRIGIAVLVGIVAHAGLAVADDAPAAAPPIASSENPVGHATIDTETSATREAEFEQTPYLPQIFAHQWIYRGSEITTPEASADERRDGPVDGRRGGPSGAPAQSRRCARNA